MIYDFCHRLFFICEFIPAKIHRFSIFSLEIICIFTTKLLLSLLSNVFSCIFLCLLNNINSILIRTPEKMDGIGMSNISHRLCSVFVFVYMCAFVGRIEIFTVCSLYFNETVKSISFSWTARAHEPFSLAQATHFRVNNQIFFRMKFYFSFSLFHFSRLNAIEVTSCSIAFGFYDDENALLVAVHLRYSIRMYRRMLLAFSYTIFSYTPSLMFSLNLVSVHFFFFALSTGINW